jgi:hypothetical protein
VRGRVTWLELLARKEGDRFEQIDLSLQEMGYLPHFLYFSILRNIIEIYFSVSKLRKVPVTDERRAVYSSVNRRIYIGQPTKVWFRIRRPKCPHVPNTAAP